MSDAPITNHRLLAREHLAEGAALAEEGHRGAAARRLLAASQHALAELAARGAPPVDPRPLLRRLERAGTASEVSMCVPAVQALVDLATDLPAGAAAPRWCVEADVAGVPFDADPLPVRSTPWLRGAAAARRRRRWRRLRRLAVVAGCLLTTGGVLAALTSDGRPTDRAYPHRTTLGVFDWSS